jgi:hypothetical protein
MKVQKIMSNNQSQSCAVHLASGHYRFGPRVLAKGALYPARCDRLLKQVIESSVNRAPPLHFQSGNEKDVRKDKYLRSLEAKVKEVRKDRRRGTHNSNIPKMKFQSGEELPDFPEQLMDVGENMIALSAVLSKCNDVQSATAAVFLFFKTRYHSSVSYKIVDYLTTLYLDYEPQDGDEESKETWLDLFKRMFSKWPRVINSSAFTKVSKLISLCAALGLCRLADFDFSVQGIKMFSIPAHSKHVSAKDFLSAVLDTITYFIKGGYECFKRGNLDYFLYDNLDAREFEEKFFKILDMAPHVRAGNLEKLYSTTENEYDRLLSEVLKQAEGFHQNSTGTWEKKVLYERLTKLKQIRADFLSYRAEGKLREAPFTVFVEGPSSVGKSYVSQLLMRTILKCNGYDASDSSLIVLNENDKYMSNYRSYINGIFIDDIGNTKPDFVEKAPSQKIIEICNNVPTYANMAEVDMKGKVTIEPKCVVMTSNKTLHDIARIYSQDVMSIARRANVHLYIRVKPDYCKKGTTMLDSSKVRRDFGDDKFPDVWEISMKIAETSTGDKVTYRDVFPNPVDITTCVGTTLDMSNDHFANQRFVVEQSSNLDEKIKTCSICCRPEKLCSCALSKQNGDAFDQEKVIEDFKEFFVTNPWTRWIFYLPAFLFDNKVTQLLLMYMYRSNVFKEQFDAQRRDPYNKFCAYGVYFATLLPLVMYSPLISLAYLISTIYIYICTLVSRMNRLVKKFAFIRGQTPTIFESIRENKAKALIATSATIAGVYMCVKFLKKMYGFLPQGNLTPSSYEEAVERDNEPNPWAGVRFSSLPVNDHAQTTTCEQLDNLVQKNLAYMRILDCDDGVPCCDAFFPKSNIVIFPQHMWREKTHFIEFVLGREGYFSHSYKGYVSQEMTYVIPNTDFCIAYVPFVGSMKDLSRFFLKETPKVSVPAHMLHRSKIGEFSTNKAILAPAYNIRVQDTTFDGFKYRLGVETFNGLCMATWVTETKTPYIAGFHLGGKGCNGAAGYFLSHYIELAEKHLADIPGVLLAKSEGNMKTVLYEKQFYQGPKVHDKSPVKFLKDDATFKFYGSVEGRATYNSEVVRTPISKTVEKVCGVPCKWGRPKFHPWKPWQKCLASTSRPSVGVPPEHLSWAVSDYIKPLKELIIGDKGWMHEIKPLTEMETVCGKDGVRFIDKMPPNTSVGFPLSGSKSNYLTALDPEQYPGFNCPMELDPMFWDHAKEMEKSYINGERNYPIFKACLKDEPTKLEKDKVRVFQGAPIAFQLLVRKFYLPLCRFLSMNPILSECAVGVNSQGPEWNTLARHMFKFGKDRIFAGDYGTYDYRMPAQVNLASFSILIDLAEASRNYSPQDISVMRGIATDICYPVTAFNGDLMEFIGTSPSGHNLTVYINAMGNSLLLRCAFRCVMDSSEFVFRAYVALMTYGDDVKGSVHVEADAFNHISAANYLKECDIVFTMPDKTSTPTKYMLDEDADFLKRKNIYNEELDMYFGALDENSIFKSLHTVLKSKALSTKEQAMCNIDGALREWFAYGKEHYEMRRAQMKQVAEIAGIAHGCLELDIDYEQRLKNFRVKYLGENPDEVAEETIVYEHQSGVEHFPNETDYRPYENVPYTINFVWESYLPLISVVILIGILWFEPILVFRKPIWIFPLWFRILVSLHFGAIIHTGGISALGHLMLRDLSIVILIVWLKAVSWLLHVSLKHQ